MKSPWCDFETAWLEEMNNLDTGRFALSTAPPLDSPSISLQYRTKQTDMPHGGGPLGQRCHHNTKSHPMHVKHDEPMESKPAKEPVPQAKGYDEIRARIGKGKK